MISECIRAAGKKVWGVQQLSVSRVGWVGGYVIRVEDWQSCLPMSLFEQPELAEHLLTIAELGECSQGAVDTFF